jgi:transaldolase
MNKPHASTAQNPLTQVIRFGQSIWYDGLIGAAEFDRMIREDGIRGATTNPAIFEKALGERGMDPGTSALVRSQSAPEAYKSIAVRAVQEVCDLFAPMYRDTKGADGYVSIEVNPHFAHDTERTLAEARELWRRVARPNVMIKIPATAQGLPAIEAAIAEGLNVNVTLIFAVKRHREVMDAYLSGLEKRARTGGGLESVASVASFFVSRVDSSVDKLLEERIQRADAALEAALHGLLGKAGIANSKLAYEAFEDVFRRGARFEALSKKGARPQRPLWASTGTKNPRYSDVLYVESLMGPDTVNTVPPATLAAFRDHGVAASRLKEAPDEARAQIQALADNRISLELVTEELETSGVKLFCDAYDKIIEGLKAKQS